MHRTVDGRCLIFNTRTKFFAKIDRVLYEKLCGIINSEDIDDCDLELSEESLNTLINAKVLVSKHEDEDYFNLKKFLRYKKAFSENGIGLVIVPTLACNFKCPYCYESNITQHTMSGTTTCQIVEFAKQHSKTGKINLCWHGGEPLLAFDKICGILDKIADDKDLWLHNHSMVTNGYLLDKEKCKKLNNYNLKSIQITIDGDRNFHDKSRMHKQGLPTYDKIISNIENVFDFIPECKVIVRVNLRPENKELFPSIYHELMGKWSGKNFSINIAFVNDVNNVCNVACLPSKGKISFLKEMEDKYGITGINANCSQQVGGCSATYTNSFIIGPDGEIYKCWVDVGKKDRIVSNIFDGKVKNMILPSYIVGSDMFSDERCRKCVFMPLCDGGCVIRRYNRRHFGVDFDPCPVNEEDFKALIEMYAKNTKTTL